MLGSSRYQGWDRREKDGEVGKKNQNNFNIAQLIQTNVYPMKFFGRSYVKNELF